MFRDFFKYEKKKIKRIFYFHVVYFLAFSLIFGLVAYSIYLSGFNSGSHTPASHAFGLFLIFGMILMGILSLGLAAYIVILAVCGPKYIFPSKFFLVIFILLLRLIGFFMPDWSLTGGYRDYLKANGDLDCIHKWLVNYEMSDYEFINEDGSKHGRVDDFDYPDCIKALNPHRVLISEKNSKKYILLMYRFGIDWDFGLCVMEEPMDIPDYRVDSPDVRIQLQDIAFVWSSCH